MSDPDPVPSPAVDSSAFDFAAAELPAEEAELPPGTGWSSDPDWALVARVGAGDQAALATLYRQHHDRLWRFVVRIAGDAATADEIVNEVMMVVWTKAGATVPQAKVTTWLLGIAYRRSLKAAERGRRHGAQTPITDEIEESTGECDARMGEMESREVVRAALGHLPAEQRAVMQMVYEEGLHYSDIAALLGCPENTVKTRIFHARRKLRSIWTQLTGSAAPGATPARKKEIS